MTQLKLLTLALLMACTLLAAPTRAAQTPDCKSLFDQAETLRNHSDFTAAQTQYQASLDCYRQAQNPDGETGALAGLGLVAEVFGQYDQALTNHEQALAISRELKNKQGEAASLSNIGGVYNRQGKYDQALEKHQQSLAIEKEIGNKKGEAISLNNIGMTYHHQGKYDQALEFYQQALPIHKGIGNRLEEATTLGNLGSVYEAQEKYDQALEFHQQSLTIEKGIGRKQGKAITLGHIGGVYAQQEKYDHALDLLQQALTLSQEIGVKGSEATTLNALGQVYEKQGQVEQARVYYEQAIALVETLRGQYRLAEDSAQFGHKNADLYEGQIRLLAQAAQPDAKLIFGYVQQAKARSFLDQMGNAARPKPRHAADETLLQEEAGWRQAIQQAEARLRGGEGLGLRQGQPSLPNLTEAERKQLSADLEQYRQRHADLLARIQRLNPQYANLISVQPAKLEEIQARLSAQTALVEYYLLGGNTLFAKGVLVFVVTPDKIHSQTLPLSEFELLLTLDQYNKNTTADTSRFPDEMKTLYDMLIRPIAAELTTTTHLLIAPHRQLHQFPFAAFHDGQHYLIEQYELSFIASGSLLPFIPDRRSAWPGPPLVMGDPLGDLSSSRVEASEVAQAYHVPAYLNEEATEARFWQEATAAGIIHLSTHGVYNPTQPTASYLRFASAAADSGGANDSYLYGDEIYDLELPQTDLVVLSACETQLGSESAGEVKITITNPDSNTRTDLPINLLKGGDELQSLSRAFMYAGAASVIGTLWKVEDESTAYIMTQFYSYLNQGYPKGQALQLAQKDAIRHPDYAHPYYWAGFVLTGDVGVSSAVTCQQSGWCRNAAWLKQAWGGLKQWFNNSSILIQVFFWLVVGITVVIGSIWGLATYNSRNDVPKIRNRKRT